MKFKIFILLAIVLPCVFIFIACTPKEPPPQHVGELEWSIDEEKHWHECIQKNCLEIFDEQVHMWTSGVQTTAPTCDTEGVLTYTCIICGHTKTQSLGYASEHTASGVWETSPVKHWQVSKCEHQVYINQGKHDFDANNVCKVCNYKNQQVGDTIPTLK